MAGLDQFLSSLMVSLVRARQAADLESALIAEEYQRHPLLSGLGAPRVRMGEVAVEFPLGLLATSDGSPGPVLDSSSMAAELLQVVEQASARVGVDLTAEVRRSLLQKLSHNLEQLSTRWEDGQPGPVPIESLSRRAQETVREVLSAGRRRVPAEALRAVLSSVQERAFEFAIAAGRIPPGVTIQVATDEVRELPKEAVSRVRVVFREEGLEWAVLSSDAGIKSTLTPE